jgi:3-deoxy-D-manno-octulosonic-acid transferase
MSYYINFDSPKTTIMRIIYNIGVYLFTAFVNFFSLFNHKAYLWAAGRKNWERALREKIISGDKYLWVHCASLGEFEQGRPVIEMIKKEKPDSKIILTFFSPSGYEIRKNYRHADIICYLPSDTPYNSRRFTEIVNPSAAVFVKYEFWNNYISELNRKGIPLYMVSGIFRPGQHFFKWYGGFFRGMLKKFTYFFLQDKVSLDLLSSIGITNASLAGDTRFDRVYEIAASARDIPELELFRGNEKLFLAGSSWKPDEEVIAQYINAFPEKMKWVFAPHEIEPSNIERLERLLKVSCVRFSGLDAASAGARVLIIDNIGMLSSAYRYASIAAVGGGFGKGIHNILEPACWGIPVIFGPNYRKFKEAVDLIGLGGAVSFSNYEGFKQILDRWLGDEVLYSEAAGTAGKYVRDNTGATARIMTKII